MEEVHRGQFHTKKHKIMAQYFTFLIVFLFFVSCNNSAQSVRTSSNQVDTDRFSKLAHRIPDSLRSEEQKEILRKMDSIAVNHIKVEENKMYLDLSKQDFLKLDVPIEYYQLLIDVNDQNRHAASMDQDDINLEKSFNEIKKKINRESA